ncbi:MAG: DNA repair protein RadC [Oscillospiraceae bacterium]|jgi:DNA repair protein RadC|nr:DNA repair protein RadC [Oscillospiraceae bacterium]
MPEDNIHVNHRKRVKERFLREGLDGFLPHEALELLLYYTNPRGDTNPTAHRLIDEFGGLDGVMDADFDDLLTVNGVGKESALFLKLLPALCRRYYTARYKEVHRFKSPAEIGEFFRSLFVGETTELVYALYLDNSVKMLRLTQISRGGFSRVSLDVRKIVETAIRVQATGIVLAHNHPKGLALPSQSDAEATRELFLTLQRMDIRLEDHIIAGEDDYVSMRLSQDFHGIFE